MNNDTNQTQSSASHQSNVNHRPSASQPVQSQGKKVDRQHKLPFIITTIIVFIIAEIGRLSSPGWMLFFTPMFAAMFLGASTCFILFKNKQLIDYIIYTIICTLYIMWGYTWVDVVDYGDPSSLLISMTGADYTIVSTINSYIVGITVIFEIFPLVRFVTKNHPRRDLNIPKDKNRNLYLGLTGGIVALVLLVITLIALQTNLYSLIVTSAVFDAIFAWGGICFANIKKKEKNDYWVFGGLCLCLVLSNLGLVSVVLMQDVNQLLMQLGSASIGCLIALAVVLTCRRHSEKYARS